MSSSTSCCKDPFRSWFEAVESLDEFIGIPFGWIQPGSGKVEWHYLRHTGYDGIGGLAHLLREGGADLGRLPQIPHSARESWWPFVRSIPRMLLPRRRLEFHELKAGDPARSSTVAPPAIAWHVFDPEETAHIRRASRLWKVTVNSYLLRYLDRAVRPSLEDPSVAVSWMVPVNLRGKVTQLNDLQNHWSYVAVRIRSSDSPSDVHRAIYRKLRKGEHWAHWKAYKCGSNLNLELKRYLIKTGHAISPWNVGSFSNLGAWDATRRLEGHRSDGAWLFAPPVLRCQPLGIGCITFRNRLSLTIQVHPDFTTDPAVPAAWLRDWVEEIKLDFPPPRSAGETDLNGAPAETGPGPQPHQAGMGYANLAP